MRKIKTLAASAAVAALMLAAPAVGVTLFGPDHAQAQTGGGGTGGTGGAQQGGTGATGAGPSPGTGGSLGGSQQGTGTATDGMRRNDPSAGTGSATDCRPGDTRPQCMNRQ